MKTNEEYLTMQLDKISGKVMADAAEEFTNPADKDWQQKALDILTPIGMEHIKTVSARGPDARNNVRKNKRNAKRRCYDYVKSNCDVTPEAVGFAGILGGILFSWALNKLITWLANKLIDLFLFDDD